MKLPSSPQRTRFGFRFIELSRRWRRALDLHLANHGLTDATWAPLVHLCESGDGILQKELAYRVGLDTSSLVRVLDILCERGLIERREDISDRRARRIFLTEPGHQAIHDIRTMLFEIEKQVLADVSDAEIASLLRCMEKISGRVQNMLDTKAD